MCCIHEDLSCIYKIIFHTGSEKTLENVAERKENTETEIEEYAKKEPEKPVNTQKFEKQTVIILNIMRMNLINIYLNKRKGKIGYRREMSIDS